MPPAIAQADAPPLAFAAERPPRTTARVVWRALWMSRLVVLAAGVLAVLQIGSRAGWQGFDPIHVTSPFGYFGNLLAAPFARWDSVWYLTIAQHGYAHEVARTAFFPLYPLLVSGLGAVTGQYLIAGIVISLVTCAIGLALVHRLALMDLDPERAEVTVMLIAFCPMAYFLSAVYSESLYLALSVGCVLQARRGRWASAGAFGALAAAARSTGIVLVVPFILLFLYGPRADRAEPTWHWPRLAATRWRRFLPRYQVTAQVLWAALIPLGLAAYVAYLAIATGDGLSTFHSEAVWYHHFAGPFGGIWDGAVAAWDGLRQLLHGPAPPIYFAKAGGDPLLVAGQNLMLFAFLVLGAVALVGAFRRLPVAYGAYTLASLALPLSEPVTPQPLASLPRYELVLFPLFMWGAGVLVRRRWTTPALAALAVLLGLFTAEFATWRFVA
jgi:hypothetical protein